MSLPRAVQQAEEAANNLITGNTSPTETPTETPQPTQQPATPPETPLAQDGNELPNNPPVTSDNIDWKAKYQVLQGKYNKEVKAIQDNANSVEPSALANEASDVLKNENDALRQQLAELQTQVSQPEPTLNEHLVSEYGEEFAKAVAETANAQVAAVRDEFNNKFTQQEQDISSWTTESKMTAVKQSLASQNIDFSLVDNDPLFHEWLAEPDQYSGQPRHAMMMNAFNSGDLSRVTRFFTAFVESTQLRSENHPLSEHVQAPPNDFQDTGTTQPVFDSDAFQDLHRRYQRGKISEEEFVVKEREIYAALQR